MRPQGDVTWTVGLIPMIEPDVVTDIISRAGRYGQPKFHAQCRVGHMGRADA